MFLPPVVRPSNVTAVPPVWEYFCFVPLPGVKAANTLCGHDGSMPFSLACSRAQAWITGSAPAVNTNREGIRPTPYHPSLAATVPPRTSSADSTVYPVPAKETSPSSLFLHTIATGFPSFFRL